MFLLIFEKLVKCCVRFWNYTWILQFPLKSHLVFSLQKYPDNFSNPTQHATWGNRKSINVKGVAKCNHINLKWQRQKFTTQIQQWWLGWRWGVKESRPRWSAKVSLSTRQPSMTGSIWQRRQEIMMLKVCQGQHQGRKIQGLGATGGASSGSNQEEDEEDSEEETFHDSLWGKTGYSWACWCLY